MQTLPLHTILGAGGSISNALVEELSARKLPFRLVSRTKASAQGAAQSLSADLTDPQQTIDAVAGSRIVYLLAGLKYDHKLWAATWPRIMDNVLEASKRSGARLIFFDNVYMYGRVRGAMTEETPFRPTSRKGEIRAAVATTLINAWKAGLLTAMIARAADFYGPRAKNGVANAMIFDPMSKRQTPMCLVSDVLPHSYTYVPDAGRALVTLAEFDSAWNQTWHLPTTAHPLTSRELITAAAQAMGRPPKYRILSRPMVKLFGFINPTVREVYEMLYQNDAPYLFDSSKYARAFGFGGTPYAEGIQATAVSYRATA
ncbi:MAG: NAD-dependent epimerase/dehydratase family protein [Terracidiphilus sp.]